MIWSDLVPPFVAERQLAWERRRAVARMWATGQFTQAQIGRRFCGVGKARVYQMIMVSRLLKHALSPVEQYLADDSDVRALLNPTKKMRMENWRKKFARRKPDGKYCQPANAKAWAIGRVLPRGGFHVRRVVWGRLMARAEKRDGETIRNALILVKRS